MASNCRRKRSGWCVRCRSFSDQAWRDRQGPVAIRTLYRRLGTRSIGAGWNKKTPSLYPEPKKNFSPFQWRWRDGKAALDAAGRLINTDLAERRNLILHNPGDPNDYATVHTLIAAYQMILPGEKARSHRHTPNALRFVLDGEGSYTIVDGERLDMHPNDVLLTPNWCWHGHASDAEGACSWMDCLDVPMVHFMEPMFYEQHPEVYEPVRARPVESDYLFAWDGVQIELDRTAPDPKGRYGRRIELGEVDAALAALPGVRGGAAATFWRYRAGGCSSTASRPTPPCSR